MEEKFILKENAFLGFLFRYAPIQIFGSIVLSFIDKFIGIDIINTILSTILFIGAIVWGLLPLKNTNRELLITDKAIVVMKNKKKRPQVLQQIAVDQVNRVTKYENGDYLVELSDQTAEAISLTVAMNPTNDQIFKVDAAFEKLLGEKFDMQDKTEVKKYLETSVVPEYVADEDKTLKNNTIVGIVSCVIFGIIPTILGVLCLLQCIIYILLLILSPFASN